MAYRTTAKMAERKEQQRARLLDTAITLFGRHGYHATTVPMIVQAADTSTGSFYFYFRNKEDVFAAALESFDKKIVAALTEAMAAAPPSLPNKMRAAVERFVTLMAENPGQARILIVESSGLGGKLELVRRKIVAGHARAVSNALATLRPDLDATITARCWAGSVYEAVYAWLERPVKQRPPASVLAKTVADFNLRGAGIL